jgi:hypothetical protein
MAQELANRNKKSKVIFQEIDSVRAKLIASDLGDHSKLGSSIEND